MAGGNKFNGGELNGAFWGSNSVSTALADNRMRQDSGTCSFTASVETAVKYGDIPRFSRKHELTEPG